MSFDNEVAQGKRFEFGKNWAKYLGVLDDDRIQVAETSLCHMLRVDSLENRSFLDIGSGSGLFSLAARRLGATVHSFDYDPNSVACTREMKRRFFGEDDQKWTVEQGSVLDEGYLESLGIYDVVYSWGVLHHTGDMWKALENVAQLVKTDGGRLFIAIYNDQGFMSRFWLRVKHIYNANFLSRTLVKVIFYPWFTMRSVLAGCVKYRNPFGKFSEYRKTRGMAMVRDWDDWLGGYPFEVAKPEKLMLFYMDKGFNLVNMKSTNRLGCNELVFERGLVN